MHKSTSHDILCSYGTNGFIIVFMKLTYLPYHKTFNASQSVSITVFVEFLSFSNETATFCELDSLLYLICLIYDGWTIFYVNYNFIDVGIIT